jgi:hypothetical protein
MYLAARCPVVVLLRLVRRTNILIWILPPLELAQYRKYTAEVLLNAPDVAKTSGV